MVIGHFKRALIEHLIVEGTPRGVVALQRGFVMRVEMLRHVEPRAVSNHT